MIILLLFILGPNISQCDLMFVLLFYNFGLVSSSLSIFDECFQSYLEVTVLKVM